MGQDISVNKNTIYKVSAIVRTSDDATAELLVINSEGTNLAENIVQTKDTFQALELVFNTNEETLIDICFCNKSTKSALATAFTLKKIDNEMLKI